jgi:hypothetical protein
MDSTAHTQERLLYKQVKKIPLIELLKKEHKIPRGRTHAIVEQASTDILAFCSEDYKLRKNSSIYKPFEKLLKEENIQFQKHIIVVDGNKFYVDYIINHKLKSSIVNDIIPKLSIWNSYDGTVKTQIHFGYHRLLCGNGLSRPVGCQIKLSSKHSADEDEFINETVPHFLDMFKVFLKESTFDIKIFERMQRKKVSDSFLEDIADKLKFSKEAREVAKVQMKKEISGDMSYINIAGELVLSSKSPVTVFAVYNALNYAIYHTNSKELPEFKNKRDRLLVDEICHFI